MGPGQLGEQVIEMVVVRKNDIFWIHNLDLGSSKWFHW